MNENTQESIGEQIGGTIGREIGKEVGKEIEKNVTGGNRDKPKKKKGYKISDAIGGIIGTAVCLFVANNLEGWGFPILTNQWGEVLRVVNIACISTMVVWVILIPIHPRNIFYFGKTLIDLLSLWSLWVTATMFPFDFSVWSGWGWLGTVFLIALWIGFVVTIVQITIRSFKLTSGQDFNQ